MALPFFFADHIPDSGELTLDEENSRHIVQVLRMQPGEKFLLTDGKGNAAETEISDAHKKHCTVNIISSTVTERSSPRLTIAISLIKNAGRFEWFLEKATELGTAEIIPLITDRTEKQHSRHERFVSICRSAMLQSSQVWMPVVHKPQYFSDVVENARQQQKLIAHCTEEDKTGLASAFNASLESHIILIGPEGDFSDQEIVKAKTLDFKGVSLGNTRLRTETAGIYAAVVCKR